MKAMKKEKLIYTIESKSKLRPLLVIYDLIIYLLTSVFAVLLCHGKNPAFSSFLPLQIAAGFAIVFLSRLLWGVYRQIWRYGDVQSYIAIMLADACSAVCICVADSLLTLGSAPFNREITAASLDLLVAMAMRMTYQYAYRHSDSNTKKGLICYRLLRLTGSTVRKPDEIGSESKIKVAVIGAGRTGTALVRELLGNERSPYIPRFFVDKDKGKTGRVICGLPVYLDSEVTASLLRRRGIQEVIVAVPAADADEKKKIYEYYKDLGCKVKVYDFPVIESAGKRSIREFDIEELLFRRPINMEYEKSKTYYQNKTILITGGGGSIGSELCRQLAKMEPKRLVILDIAENGAYDVQQELKLASAGKLDVRIEIATVCDRRALERVFREHQPQVVIMAAAHKHVPLMEKNCIEAVNNNVFGTLNTVEVSVAFGAERVILVSTDKAVNPTNVMGATKRMCEMIVQTYSARGYKTTFSMTRFGNVLGSAGSVIPLFKRQIAQGGPITLTDRRIIRYFMTIPEASQLVLLSGAMAKNGELFVLDMGQPVKILDLAESIIRLTGAQDIEIVETGLRPGEKLYEELLVKSEELDKTENELIFIERDKPLPEEELNERLDLLRQAVETDSDEEIKRVMPRCVPTYRVPATV